MNRKKQLVDLAVAAGFIVSRVFIDGANSFAGRRDNKVRYKLVLHKHNRAEVSPIAVVGLAAIVKGSVKDVVDAYPWQRKNNYSVRGMCMTVWFSCRSGNPRPKRGLHGGNTGK